MKKFIGGMLLLSLLGAVGSYGWYEREINEPKEYDRILEIKAGVPLKASLSQLKEYENPAFKIYLKFSRNQGRGIKAGYYELKGNLSIKEIVDLLEEGREKVYKITIPEGYTVKNIIEIFEREKRGKAENFETAFQEIDFPYPTPNKNFEGYLYPETYFFPENYSEKQVVETLLKEFLKKFPAEEYPDKEKFYRDLIMASIIQREALVADEKPLISSVFHNRLKKGMTLSSDATVNYLYDYKKKRIYYKDLEVATPYSTYKNKGLPPAPISNPDYNSVIAAMNPLATEYLFFVATGDGSHFFSKTYKEHLEFQKKNKNKGEKNWKR